MYFLAKLFLVITVVIDKPYLYCYGFMGVTALIIINDGAHFLNMRRFKQQQTKLDLVVHALSLALFGMNIYLVINVTRSRFITAESYDEAEINQIAALIKIFILLFCYTKVAVFISEISKGIY